jgi:signal transduction histidine kinase
MHPSAPSSWPTWLFYATPLLLLGWGILVAVIRWVKLRRPAVQPEALLLGAVSKSLQERGELAASLGELRTVHERLVDALPFGLLWRDAKGRVAAINAEGQALLGVTRGVVGLSAEFVLEPYPWLRDALALAPGPEQRLEAGGRVWRVRRIAAPDPVGALVTFEDITAAEAEARRLQLRERFAELGEMTAGVAHQLKNGLAVIRGHGQLLERAGHAEAAQAVLEEADALGQVVQRFLQWAKPLEPRLQPVRLEDVVGAVLVELARRPLAQNRRLRVEGQGAASADPALLHQALVNLLENACQATPAGGEVSVRIAEGLIEILDQGPGMDEDTAIRMLRPFESSRPDGTGLGLPLALKWINAFGADLVLVKRTEGGTLASIRW